MKLVIGLFCISLVSLGYLVAQSSSPPLSESARVTILELKVNDLQEHIDRITVYCNQLADSYNDQAETLYNMQNPQSLPLPKNQEENKI